MSSGGISPSSIGALVADAAGRFPDSPALLAPQRAPLTYRRLMGQVRATAAWLNRTGMQRSDRVAIVLPNGPEMAVAFLSVAAAAASAPLNPVYRQEQFEFYLGDIGAKALITAAGVAPEAMAAANALGIRIIVLNPAGNAEAGRFTLDDCVLDGGGSDDDGLAARADDAALLLHTSGTTSRPKIVPLTHANLCASARNVAASLALEPADRCLNIMPLFHIHGLVAAVLASLYSGGSVVCSPHFDGDSFFKWMDEFQPSWYTAAPALHQEILRRAPAGGSASKGRLRFIRSASSALPPLVLQGLEEAFGAPVIEAYGMTEAAHQIAVNPLPPRERKPGSVGLPAGTDAAAMNDSGELLPAGAPGEIVIRGANVASGYENNPEANHRSFVNGWFRTGDAGVIDRDGFVWLKGRIKEIINRGGEKIAPLEIDEVLMRHPAVAQAAAFAVAHPTLGEAVAAAVTPKDGSSVTESELRDFALQHLPEFKAPARFLILSDIPKGPTGKVQRVGLAERLASRLEIAYEAASGEAERMCAGIFEEVLQRSPVGRKDNFFALGGDSLRGMQVVARLVESFGIEVAPTVLFHRPTPALLAEHIDVLRQDSELVRARTDETPKEA